MNEFLSSQNSDPTEFDLLKKRNKSALTYNKVNRFRAMMGDKKNRRRTIVSKIIGTFNKKNKKFPKNCGLQELASKESDQRLKEVRDIFKSEKTMSNNVKSLQKEKKINDTIVAFMSLFMIILCFYQVCD
jgi:hypothetical protein